jgi:hypothetical protein
VRLTFKTWGLVKYDTIQDLTHQPFLVLGDCFERSSSRKRMKVREYNLTDDIWALAKKMKMVICPTPSYLRAAKPPGVDSF